MSVILPFLPECIAASQLTMMPWTGPARVAHGGLPAMARSWHGMSSQRSPHSPSIPCIKGPNSFLLTCTRRSSIPRSFSHSHDSQQPLIFPKHTDPLFPSLFLPLDTLHHRLSLPVSLCLPLPCPLRLPATAIRQQIRSREFIPCRSMRCMAARNSTFRL